MTPNLHLDYDLPDDDDYLDGLQRDVALDDVDDASSRARGIPREQVPHESGRYHHGQHGEDRRYHDAHLPARAFRAHEPLVRRETLPANGTVFSAG